MGLALEACGGVFGFSGHRNKLTVDYTHFHHQENATPMATGEENDYRIRIQWDISM